MPFEFNPFTGTLDKVNADVDLTPYAKLDTTNDGDIGIASTKYFYIGDSSVDGSWRIGISGSDLSFERRESGAWVQKSAATP